MFLQFTELFYAESQWQNSTVPSWAIEKHSKDEQKSTYCWFECSWIIIIIIIMSIKSIWLFDQFNRRWVNFCIPICCERLWMCMYERALIPQRQLKCKRLNVEAILLGSHSRRVKVANEIKRTTKNGIFQPMLLLLLRIERSGPAYLLQLWQFASRIKLCTSCICVRH